MGRGFVYDGVDLSPYIKCRFDRPLAPPIAIDEEPVPGRRGTAFLGARLDPLDIPVHVRLASANLSASAARNALAPLLVKNEPKALVLPDETIARYAILSGESMLDRLWESGAADIVFHCPDPVGYGETRTATIPSGGHVSFVVGGNYPTAPEVRTSDASRSASSGLWGVSADTGEHMHVAISAATKTVRFLCARRRCLTTANLTETAMTLDSDWLTLEPGNHVVTMDEGTGAATVTWTERWL